MHLAPIFPKIWSKSGDSSPYDHPQKKGKLQPIRRDLSIEKVFSNIEYLLTTMDGNRISAS